MATSQAEPLFPGAPVESLNLQDRSRLFPDLNQYLLTHSNLRTTFPGLCRKLNRALPHQHAGIALYESGPGNLRLFTQLSSTDASALPDGFVFPLDGTPAGEVYRMQRPMVVEDLRSPQFLCETTRELMLHGQRSGCWVPLRATDGVLGVLWVGSDQPGAYTRDDAFLLNDVAVTVAIALHDHLNSIRVHELEKRISCAINDAQQQDGVSQSPEIANTRAIGIVQWEEGGRFSNPNDTFLRMLARTRDEIERNGNCFVFTPSEHHHLTQQAEQELLELGNCRPFEGELLRPDGLRVPVLISAAVSGQRRPPWLAFVMDLRDRRSLSLPTSQSKKLPSADIIHVPGHEGEDIVAESVAMRKILRDVERAAPTDSTMLLLGETGTGKDVLAHAIAQMSQRRDHPFIKVNCASIPAGLLESELFGHEKGAFTGAQGRKIGRLELAHQGTIFLDEVGDLPLELQPKLLRVLQERAFERLGGTQTIKVNVRLIAATNRDLAQMTTSGQFRRDLFYRLNVCPIRVPPLRERPESVPILAERFVQKFARRMNRPHLTILPETMAALERWIWPGNIRELENLIERAVILSPGPELRVNLQEMRILPPNQTPPGQQTLCDVEREHIRHVLHDTNGIIGGKHGAAKRLGLKRTTLQYKMKKLEISRY